MAPSGILLNGAVIIEGSKIVEVSDGPNSSPPERDELVIDAEGLMVCPGLIEMHTHGLCGVDVWDGTPEAIKTIVEGKVVYDAEKAGINT